MRQISVAGFATICLLVGCGRHAAFISSAVDPAFSPQRDEAVVIVLPTQSTVMERQLLPVLKGELASAHFQLIDDISKAKWVLALSANRTEVTYAVSSFVIKINPQLALATPPIRTVPTTTIYLTLLDAKDYSKGEALATWHGAATALDRAFEAGNNEMIRRMLEVYGKNINRNMHITKSKLQKAFSSE